MPDEASTGRSARVPDAEHLLRLPPDDWAGLLRHTRAAMRDLDDHLITPSIERLRAVPASKLVDGRSRRDLCRVLAEGGPVWREVADRISQDPSIDLEHLLSPDAVVPQPPDTTEQETPADDDRIHRLKERARDLKDERDDARRRADGLEARLRTERDRIEELRRALSETREQRDELAERLEVAAEDRREALERQERRYEAELYQLREELRVHRRRQQQREERRRRRSERRERTEERAREEVEAHLSRQRPDRRAEPGRPSRLPAGIQPDTPDALDLLLTGGRRVLIDGYNVTKQHRGHLDLEQQRQWLVVRATQLQRRRRVRCTVVFDGDAAVGPAASVARGAQVVFTADATADDRIVEVVADLPPDEPVLVVTDDRGLRDRLRDHAVDLAGTAAFVTFL